MSRFEIIHETRFEYSAPISETVMELRLRPQDGGGQRCLDFHLEVEPRAGIRGYRDGYGNQVHYFNLLRDHPRLRVTSRSLVETGLPVECYSDQEVTAKAEQVYLHIFNVYTSPSVSAIVH